MYWFTTPEPVTSGFSVMHDVDAHADEMHEPMESMSHHMAPSLAPVPMAREQKFMASRLTIQRQPPIEVRTRTPADSRVFSAAVGVEEPFGVRRVYSVEVRLYYAEHLELGPLSNILGGRLRVPVKDGVAIFDGLTMAEASAKHGERLFCLEFVPYSLDDVPLEEAAVLSRRFYAYSHNKVLARRKGIKLRALSRPYASLSGGDRLHIVGQTFLRLPTLSVGIELPDGRLLAGLDVELFSENVLFFVMPQHPDRSALMSGVPVPVVVRVTNDGRSYSEGLQMYYVHEAALAHLPQLH